MTEFTETALRHMCRNPRCRSKLPAPVSNRVVLRPFHLVWPPAELL